MCTDGDKGRNDHENRDVQDRDSVQTYIIYVLARIDGWRGVVLREGGDKSPWELTRVRRKHALCSVYSV